MKLIRSIKTRFRYGSNTKCLNLATQRNSPARSTKSTTSHFQVVLCLLVSLGFQVLFHSPPGVLFTFPSRYYTLSVTRSYLALGDGPPAFPPDSTCPGLLWIHQVNSQVSLTRLLLSLAQLSSCIQLPSNLTLSVSKPLKISLSLGLGSFPFAHHYLGNRCFFLFLQVLRCFSSLGSPLLPYIFR